MAWLLWDRDIFSELPHEVRAIGITIMAAPEPQLHPYKYHFEGFKMVGMLYCYYKF